MPRAMIPSPSPAAIERARRELERLIGPSQILSSAEACAPYGEDESLVESRTPDLVVLARSREDVLSALRVADDCALPITPQAARTGKSGGGIPIAGGIALSVVGMRQIKDIDCKDGIAVVEPGVILGDLHRAVEAAGWFYPPDPNSWDECTLGGNVAENAGGPRAYKYGVTRDYVLGLDAHLIGGTSLSVGRRTRKGVTGYDVTALLVGSEGTLSVFGDITLRLVSKPPEVSMLMALFSELPHAAAAVPAIASVGVIPRCLELLDGTTLGALRAAGNDIDPRAQAALFIEVDGDAARCAVDAARVAEACVKAQSMKVVVPANAEERERLWAARRAMSHAIKQLAKHKLSEDVVVPTSAIPELLRRVEQHSAELQIRWLAYGHAGDGNLHVNFLWDDPEERPQVERMVAQLFRDTVALRGSLSGEHGIGLLKAPYLPLEQSTELMALQKRLKGVFDPKGLLNPGKIFPT